MLKIRTIKQVVALSLLISVFAINNPALAETTDAHEQHHQKALEWPGVYKGLPPCSDCVGIKTTLALNKNNTYVMMTIFAGKSEREFTEKGQYSYDDDTKLLILTPRHSDTTKLYYVGEKQLIQLDKQGNRYTGKDAERYILRLNDVIETVKPAHPH